MTQKKFSDLDRESYIYDFGLRYAAGLPANARDLFADAVAAVWSGRPSPTGSTRWSSAPG